MHPERDAVLSAMPRRQRIGYIDGNVDSNVDSKFTPTKEVVRVPVITVILRFLLWTRRLTSFCMANLFDEIRMRGSVVRKAKRLRQMFEALGATAIKIGQQLALRADLIPMQYCNELSKLLDEVPPFPTNEAIKIIEQSSGKSLSQLFKTFDPVPIGSGSISCVYQAELLTGERVAVKIRRPEIDVLFRSDLKVLSTLSKLAETLGIVRQDMTRAFNIDFSRMLLNELDFKQEARHTEIFQELAEGHRYLSAPRVYHKFTDFNVMVSEFISGVFISEILAAKERNDHEKLADLEAQGFDLVKISKRLQQIFFWEIFECNLFHADPHPANFIVRPNNDIYLIDFGASGTITRQYRRNLLQFYQNFIITQDIKAAVRDLIEAIEPLPPVNMQEYSHDLLIIIREFYLAHRSRHSTWQEKSAGVVWLKMINLGRKYHIPSTPDVVHFFRASFLYDSIILQLNPGINAKKEFEKWYGRFTKKSAKRIKKELYHRLTGLMDSDYHALESMTVTGQRAFERIQQFLDLPNYQFVYGINKMAYIASMVIKTVVGIILLTLVGTIFRSAYESVMNGSSFFEYRVLYVNLLWTVTRPIFLATTGTIALILCRRILLRLHDVDVHYR